MRAIALVTASPSCVQIWKSLESAGHVVTPIVAEGANQQQVVSAVRSDRPDFAIFVGSAHEHILELDVLRQIAEITPFIHLCCDGGDPPWHPHLQQYAEIFHLQVNMDGCSAPGCLTTLQLMDDRAFAPLPWHERDIRFGMSGNPGHGRRGAFVAAAQSMGLQLFKGSAPYASAAAIMCRIKIMFDHGMTGSGTANHCNCRIVEAGYAGSALFANADTPLENWLTPGVEYFKYNAAEDVEQLLQLPDNTLAAAAQALRARVLCDYAPRPAWNRILGHAGLS